MKNSSKIYLDYNATSGLDKEVASYMYNILSPSNPSSIHLFGREARKTIEEARIKIANSLSISLDEFNIIFTSSGTEANNQVIKSFGNSQLIISPIEHPSILNLAKELNNCNLIKISTQGMVDLGHLEELLQNTGPKLISVIFGNNETGVIQDIKAITMLAHKYGALVHSDAIQAYGKVPINLADLNLDIITIAAHKIGGPLGAAAIIAKKNINLKPLMIGGGQEKGLRPGTENVIAIAGFGKAAESLPERIQLMQEIAKLRDFMEKEIRAICPTVRFYSENTFRLPNTSCILMPDVSNDRQLISFDLEGIAISSGSACSSGKITPSHVLLAMGVSVEDAKCTIRISLSPTTTLQEVQKLIAAWNKIYNKHLDQTQYLYERV